MAEQKKHRAICTKNPGIQVPPSAARAPKNASGHESGLLDRKKNIKHEKVYQERMLDLEALPGAGCLLQNSQPIVWPNPVSPVGGNVCALLDGNLRRPHLRRCGIARSRQDLRIRVRHTRPAHTTPRPNQRTAKRPAANDKPDTPGRPQEEHHAARPPARTCRNDISRSGRASPPHSDIYIYI